MTPNEAGIVWSDPAEYSADANVGATSWDASSTLEWHKVKVGTDAEGVLSFNISTSSAVDSEGNPFDTRQVLVYIRRVTGINLTDTVKDASGNVPMGNNQYKAGVTYRIDAKAVGTSLEKALGLNNYDTDYVNPYYIDFTCKMTNGVNVLSDADRDLYVTNVQNVQDTENPYFQFTLGQDMPNDSEIIITAKAKHPDGGNKTGTDYGDVKMEYPIEYVFNPWSMNSDLVRGSDGVKIMFDGAFYQSIKDTYHSTKHQKTMKVYKAKVDESGDIVPDGAAIVTVPLTDDGSVTHFQYNDSKYFDPGTKYILELDIKFLNDANVVVWPLPDTDPNLYQSRHMLGEVGLTYECKQSGIGTSGVKKQATVGTEYTELMLFDGITWNELQSHIQFKVEAWIDDEWKVQTDTNLIAVQNGGNSMVKYKASVAGTYKITPYLSNFDYTKPDGTTEYVAKYDLVTGGLGELYILAQ